MNTNKQYSLVLFRADLRTFDNPALTSALKSGRPAIALFVLDEETNRPMGGASKWWLHHSLENLTMSLSALNTQLILASGDTYQAVLKLAQKVGINSIYWNRDYDAHAVELGHKLKNWAHSEAIQAKSFGSRLLHEPHTTTTKTGGFFKVFTPFWKNISATYQPLEPLPIPNALKDDISNFESDKLEDLALLPTNPDWAAAFQTLWQPGEAGAHTALETFIQNGLETYPEGRDFPSLKTTSRLSPHLRFGEITPGQIWTAVAKQGSHLTASSRDKFLSEIGWRDFAHHLLYHNPNLKDDNFNKKFDRFPWQNEANTNENLLAWQEGMTGYPIVDAGMRELWQTGWMHNRVRMIVGSFLVKHLLIDWRKGEEWFWDTLLDACPANNTASWQWIAGSGADAAPYFRIFNPILQGEKFDGEGRYVRKYVPELAQLPNKYIHKPWTAPLEQLTQANVKLGQTYPNPIVDHTEARKRALAAFESIQKAAA